MKIGIDIDDVIADFVPTLARFHNETFGGNLSKNDFTSYDFWKVWGGSKEEAVRKVDMFFEDQSHCNKILPVIKSVTSLNKLKEGGVELFAITGRRDNMIEQTKEWIEKHFPGLFLDIYFTNSYSLNGKSEKKSKICKELGITVMVEDHTKHAVDCAENAIQVLLFDCPWNKHSNVLKNIRRVSSWDEIIQVL